MALISDVSTNRILLREIPFSLLLDAPIEIFGLTTSESGEVLYLSRTYSVLNWKIKPILHFKIKSDEEVIQLSSRKINIQGLEKLEKLVKVSIDATFRKFEAGSSLIRTVEIALDIYGPLSIIPRRICLNMLAEALDVVSTRFDRTLLRRLKGLNY